MSLNTAHANGGVLIFNGEMILLYCDGVEFHIEGQDAKDFAGTKKGRIYLTSHRMIFTNKDSSDRLQSFSFPFFSMTSIELEQPIFGANFIKGKVSAQVGGNWTGQATFKLKFLTGGAIEFGQAMLQAAKMASRYMPPQPPPYTAPEGPYYPAAPPAYTAPPGGYYGFVPPTHVFPSSPPANSVYMTNMPPPYPGINPPPYGGPNAQAGVYPPGPQPPTAGYPPGPQPPMAGYPPGSAPPTAGNASAPPPMGFNTAYTGMPPNVGYPQAPMYNGATPPPPNAQALDPKAQEAAQSAYFNPYAPNYAFVPPAHPNQQPLQYDGPPPPYSEASKKNQ